MYEPRWFCKECGESGYLPHNSLAFAPDVCPGCGGDDENWRQFRAIPAKRVYRPKGLNIFRHIWVDREGKEILP